MNPPPGIFSGWAGDRSRVAALAGESACRCAAAVLGFRDRPRQIVRYCETKMFKMPHAPASQGDGHLLAIDVAMAWPRAPHRPASRRRPIDPRLYADGGLFPSGARPSGVALHGGMTWSVCTCCRSVIADTDRTSCVHTPFPIFCRRFLSLCKTSHNASRSRSASHPAPPPQIRACGATAHGSCLGS